MFKWQPGKQGPLLETVAHDRNDLLPLLMLTDLNEPEGRTKEASGRTAAEGKIQQILRFNPQIAQHSVSKSSGQVGVLPARQ